MQISQMTSAPLPWLSILVALPALGALMLAVVPALRRAGRTFALILSVCELAAAIVFQLSAFRGLLLDSPDRPELGGGRECTGRSDDSSCCRLGSPGRLGRLERR